MEKRLSSESLIRERELAKVLSISKETLAKWRSNGCPWLKLGGKVFYHEGDFMEWLLKKQKRISESE